MVVSRKREEVVLFVKFWKWIQRLPSRIYVGYGKKKKNEAQAIGKMGFSSMEKEKFAVGGDQEFRDGHVKLEMPRKHSNAFTLLSDTRVTSTILGTLYISSKTIPTILFIVFTQMLIINLPQMTELIKAEAGI